MLDSIDLASVRARSGGLRGRFREQLLGRAFRQAVELDDALLARRSVVIAPHFDDETLGCGGTLLRQAELGAERHIIFMTDGSVSHRNWIEPEVLSDRRRSEGFAAAEALGIPAECVTCLDFPETELQQHLPEAVARVRRLFKDQRPELLFIPYRHEPPADHRAAYEIAIQALQGLAAPLDVLEYPIWVWDAWPFTEFPLRPLHRMHRRMQEHWRLSRWLLRDMRSRVDIRALRGGKLAALQQHRTQMFRPDRQPDWPILRDVADGLFLDLFFEPFELFHRTTIRSPRPLPDPPEPSDA